MGTTGNLDLLKYVLFVFNATSSYSDKGPTYETSALDLFIELIINTSTLPWFNINYVIYDLSAIRQTKFAITLHCFQQVEN